MIDPIFIGGLDADTEISASRVGNKAANLARLDRLGLRVPAALALDTEASRMFAAGALTAEDVRAPLVSGIRRLEHLTGLSFGSGDRLLLSVRSSPPVSMPGLLDTVVDVGLTESSVKSLIRRTGNPWLAWDAYRRLIRSFAVAVHRLPQAPFEQLESDVMARAGAHSLQELDPAALRDLTRRSRKLLASLAPSPLPEDPFDQVIASVRGLFASWNSDSAREYRRVNGVTADTGTGVLIQAMVFGDAGPRSGSGVGCTRDPTTGDDALYVDFAFNTQGEDVVSGRCASTATTELSDALPDVWSELMAAKSVLEGEFGDMQEFEFTVEEGQLYFLQSRTGRRTARAAVQIASDMVREGLIDTATALNRVSEHDLTNLATTVLHPRGSDVRLGSAIPASGGVATGRVVFDVARVRALAADGPVILVRPNVHADEVSVVAASAGIVTRLGGRASHAAVLSRQLGKVCLVGCSDLRIAEDARECMFGRRRVREGEVITIDGESGWIYAGAIGVTTDDRADVRAIVQQWRQAQAEAIGASFPPMGGDPRR